MICEMQQASGTESAAARSPVLSSIAPTYTTTDVAEAGTRSESGVVHRSRIWLLSFVALAFVVAVLSVQPLRRINEHVSIDYNEGWNAVHAERLFSGQPLYQSDNEFLFNNYPPLSFAVVGAVGELVGDDVIAGRWISLLSLLITAMLIGAITIKATHNGPAGAFAGSLFLGTLFFYGAGYVGMNDPQMLAHALATTGLAALLWQQNPTTRSVIAASLLMVLAGFIKHNLLALPAATTVWLFLFNRRLLVPWMATSAVAVVVGMSICYAAFGMPFFDSLLNHHRRSDLELLAQNVRLILVPVAAIIAIPCAGYLCGERDRKFMLLLLYVVLSTVLGMAISGGFGVDRNAFFDLFIGGSAATIVAMEYLSKLAPAAFRMRAEAALCCVLILPFALAVPPEAMASLRIVKSFPTLAEQSAGDVQFLAEHKSDAMCETLALCYWAHAGGKVDYFNAGEAMATSFLDPGDLVKQIKEQRFSVIQTENAAGHSWRLPQAVNEAIESSYEVARVSPVSGAYLLPRSHLLSHTPAPEAAIH